MSVTLAFIVIWSIVAMVLYCCYRVWYWTPTPAARDRAIVERVREDRRRAA